MESTGGKSRNYIIGVALGLLIYICLKSAIAQYGIPTIALTAPSPDVSVSSVIPLQRTLNSTTASPPSLLKSYGDMGDIAPREPELEPERKNVDNVQPKLSLSQMVAAASTSSSDSPHGIPLLEGKNLKDPKVLAGVCQEWKKKFLLAPGLSWGTMPLKLQRKWDELRCDAVLGVGTATANSASTSIAQAAAAETVETTVEESGPAKWCANTRDKHKVVPMKSWGTLSASDMVSWKKHRCDIIFTRNRITQRPISSCADGHKNSSTIKMDSVNLPLIAIMAGSTTRKIPHPSVKSLSLFNFLLPSVARTLDCGYRYVFVLGFDEGDEFYDTTAGMSSVVKWFDEHIALPLKKNGILITFSSTSINNSLKKPGPIFNAMARYAHTVHNPDYYYRLNDDTELLTNWPSIFVQSLRTLGPPYGVVGPFCEQGNTAILTHDFVHKTHMEIFDQSYYPPQLTDWWMDDWISFVYGKKRTFRAMRVTVIHHTTAHGQRYTVDKAHEKLLGGLLVEGKKKIHRWMSKNDVPGHLLAAFDTDTFKKFSHQDVPL